VTPTGEIVWEYVNPYPRRSKDAESGKTTVSYGVYRAEPVAYDWAPAGTPHAEISVVPPENTSYHLPAKEK
jgi:hypothetical protein